MSTSSPLPSAGNPLRKLPSILATPTLRRRLERAGTVPPQREDELVALLELDPLAAARALRAAKPAIFREADSIPSARELVRCLGTQLSARLFACDPCRVADEDGLLQLWMRAVATAHAARDFATHTGHMDPDAAYLAGLLRDLPSWIRRLEAADQSDSLPTDWVVHWQLPAPIVALILDLSIEQRAVTAEEPLSDIAMIRSAELCADFAGFRHPDEQASSLTELERELRPSQLQVAVQLRERVEAALTKCGLHHADQPQPDARPRAEWGRSTAPHGLEDLVLQVLGATHPQSYRKIISRLTEAAMSTGQFDRVFFAKWDASNSMMTLRSQPGTTSSRLVEPRMKCSRPESELLQRALQTQTPAHLKAEPNGDSSMLRALSTDELLAAPFNADFEQPSFMLIDRSLTLTPLGDESESRAVQALSMAGSLLVQNQLLRWRRERSQKFALTDPLTHLFNRRMGIHSLEQAVARTERDRSPLTVLMCDLDHFKRLNDTYGHLQGDAALRATADVLRTIVRTNDTVCRYGGEEFLVVLPDTTPDEATVLATRMFTAVHAHGEALQIPLTVSIGLTCHKFGDTVESILHRSDRALYASKGYGRNRFSADVDTDDVEAPDTQPPTSGD